MVINFKRNLAFVFVFSFFLYNQSIACAGVLEPQADLYRSKGLEEQARGQYESALNFFLKANSLGPENPILYNDIGVCYEQLGSADRAEQYYLRSLTINKDFLPAYSNLGYLYLDQGNLDKAEQFFMERVKRAPAFDPWIEKIRQEIYRINPNLKASAIKLELQETARKLEVEAQQKEYQDFTLAVERSDSHFKRGEAFRAAKQYSQAINEFDAALKVTPDNPKLIKAKERVEYEERIDEVKKRIGVATEQLNTGEVDSAKNEFQQILAIIPKVSSSNSEK